MREAAVLGCSQDLDDEVGPSGRLSFLVENSRSLFFWEKRVESDKASKTGVKKISPVHPDHEYRRVKRII
jgi:hypothetical protein